jgi:hypothetical protein
MKINLYGDLDNIIQGVYLLEDELNIELTETGIPIKVINQSGPIEVKYKNDKGIIIYEKPIHFFRGLGLWFENIENKNTFDIKETPQFKTSGAMMDQSRNAVLTVESVKDLLRKMSLMGLNMMMLYTEDVYEVKEKPYFGYMRGRYTDNELSELDDYAFSLGIEMIPCIQTLAHLSQTLKWNYSIDFRDTTDILLVDEPKTYEFIEEMISAAIKPFRTNRIHIGMDEAFQLGLGTYVKKNGYEAGSKLMVKHLEKVVNILNKYDLNPMMWSDMYFRTASETGGYYDLEAKITDEIIETIPKEVQLVYWDYYHSDKDFYSKFIKKHKELGSLPIFAGGAWTWNGIAPNYGKAMATTKAALDAAKEEELEEVFVTVWGDNGAETPQSTALPVLQVFAENMYHKNVTEEDVVNRFKACTGGSFNDFMILNQLDETPGVPENNLEANSPSKFLLYQDILTGLYDKNIEGLHLNEHYQRLHDKFKNIKERSDQWGGLFDFYSALAKVLSEKSEMGIRLKESYDKKDKKKIGAIISKLKELYTDVELLRQSHRKLWFSMYKPFGWEVVDIRYGGVLSRIETAKYRLTEYLNGEINTLPELEEERLYFEGPYPMSEDALGRNNYRQIVTAGDLG